MNKWISTPIISVLVAGLAVSLFLYFQESSNLKDVEFEIVTLEENVSTLEADLVTAEAEIRTLEVYLMNLEQLIMDLEAML